MHVHASGRTFTLQCGAGSKPRYRPTVTRRGRERGRPAGRRGDDDHAAAMDQFPVRLEVERGIATITLDSPANRNALSAGLRRGLAARLGEAMADEGVRAIVVTGSGPAFCAGADLKESAAQLGGAAPIDPG